MFHLCEIVFFHQARLLQGPNLSTGFNAAEQPGLIWLKTIAYQKYRIYPSIGRPTDFIPAPSGQAQN
jgi:hypothetical protein